MELVNNSNVSGWFIIYIYKSSRLLQSDDLLRLALCNSEEETSRLTEDQSFTCLHVQEIPILSAKNKDLCNSYENVFTG